MSASNPVVVNGASGYTGRLVCEYLREFNVPFVAAGRDKARVQDVIDKIPGIETVDHEIVEVAQTVGPLTELFAGAKVVCNVVGPFSTHGPEVVEASLAAGCHYLDTTGEQAWVVAAKSRWGPQFAEQKLLLAPGVAQMYTGSEIAANICLETHSVDTLDILCLWKGFPTQASTQTIFAMLKADWFYLEGDEFHKWSPEAAFEVAIPGKHETGLALPWGGSSLPVWFKDDPRVATCKVVGGVFDRTFMEEVVATMKLVQEQVATLPVDQQEEALAKVASSVQSGMPPRENPRINTSLDSVYASGPLARLHCVLHGNRNYTQTGLLQAYAAYSLLQQPPFRTGFASPCQAFGHRTLLGVLRSFGLVMEPVLTVKA
jgi:short subunit dehydrogenase-like uncharacterized protein